MQDRTCSIEDCGKHVRTKGMCATHYNRTLPGRHAKSPVPCAACGQMVPKYSSGTRAPVCSYRCRYQVTHGRDMAQGKEVVGPVPRRPTRPGPQAPPPRRAARVFTQGTCEWCGDTFTRWSPMGGSPVSACSTRCRDRINKAKRESLKGRFAISPRRRRAIYERDGWICHLCMEPVDPTLNHQDRQAASLDHVEPQSWALIPDHRDTNLRLAHRMCNSIRQDSPLVN